MARRQHTAQPRASYAAGYFFKVSPATILRQTDPEKFLALSRDALAQEIGLNELEKEVAEALRRLSPKRRAAFLLLLQNDDARRENGNDF